VHPIAHTRLRLEFDVTYDDALDAIYDTIGCGNLVRKPLLSYKAGVQKGSTILLQNSGDWASLLDEVEMAVRKKKNDNMTIVVEEKVSE
jgi:hypothetical protein